MTDASDPGIHGWGYEGRTLDDLIAYVHSVGAATVADVRLTPLSRRPGFSKRALAERLGDVGIRYIHLPELGNPRDNRDAFARPTSPEAAAAHARFRGEILAAPDADAALHQVAQLESTGVVLLCFEADELTCHRTLIIEALDASKALVDA